MMKKNDRLIENVRQVLDQSLDDLDAATQSRLARVRHLAMDRQRSRKYRLLYWGSVPAAALILLVLMLNWPVVTLNPVVAPELEELSVLTATESLDFYQEDIEFYEWLSEILETEKKLSEHIVPQSDPVSAKDFFGTGDQCARTAESRNA